MGIKWFNVVALLVFLSDRIEQILIMKQIISQGLWYSKKNYPLFYSHFFYKLSHDKSLFWVCVHRMML